MTAAVKHDGTQAAAADEGGSIRALLLLA